MCFAENGIIQPIGFLCETFAPFVVNIFILWFILYQGFV